MGHSERVRPGFPRALCTAFGVGLLTLAANLGTAGAAGTAWSSAAPTLQQHVWFSAVTGTDFIHPTRAVWSLSS